jgi:hypothetical protein
MPHNQSCGPQPSTVGGYDEYFLEMHICNCDPSAGLAILFPGLFELFQVISICETHSYVHPRDLFPGRTMANNLHFLYPTQLPTSVNASGVFLHLSPGLSEVVNVPERKKVSLPGTNPQLSIFSSFCLASTAGPRAAEPMEMLAMKQAGHSSVWWGVAPSMKGRPAPCC